MSECFDGRNGKSVKTSGDLRYLRRSVGNEIVAVLPGKFFLRVSGIIPLTKSGGCLGVLWLSV